MSSGEKGKIAYMLITINIIPFLTFGLLILVLGTRLFTTSMYSEVEEDLQNTANTISITLDALYPGDYHLEGDTALRFYKGSRDLTGDYTLIDSIKEKTGLDITVFYQDTRILTTVTDQSGERIIGTGAPDKVLQNVLAADEPHFYNNIMILGTSYFSYYTPLHNQDGSAVGILFVGKPSADVNESVHASIYPLIVMDIVLALVMGAFILLYTKKFVSNLLQIHSFLKEVSSGNLNAKLGGDVIRRRDELGEIAASALHMQSSLRALIERDSLTSLLNRRSGDSRLRKTIEDSASHGTPFCVALGDIDLFKKVNDTYGHECGDLVLKKVSGLLRQYMHGRGFVARWGGEEFLLVFQDTEFDQAYSLLEELRKQICGLEIHYNDQPIHVTMTFGITPGAGSDMNDLIRIADEKLYEGKSAGRNRVVG